MKVLLTIEEGFAKTIFEGDKGAVEWFLKGFQYSRKTNLESPEVIGVLNELIRLTDAEIRGSLRREMPPDALPHSISDAMMKVHWSSGALSAMENKKGKLEVIE